MADSLRTTERRETDHVLRPLCTAWLKKISLASKQWEKQFGEFAREAMNYFDGDSQWLWANDFAKSRASGYLGDDTIMPNPTFRVVPNRTAEMVQLFGPAVYYQDHVRTVTYRQPVTFGPEVFGDPQDPMAQQVASMLAYQQDVTTARKQGAASVLETVANYVALEGDLKPQGRDCIQEAIVKGASWMTVELDERGMPVARQVSADDVLVDPDATKWDWDQVRWQSVWRVRPYYDVEATVEQMCQLEPGSLSGKFKPYCKAESLWREGETASNKVANYERKQGKSDDLLGYWEIYSRFGMGHEMSGVELDPEAKSWLDSCGRYVHLMICPGCPFPLNMPGDLVEDVLTTPDTLPDDPEDIQPDMLDENGQPIPQGPTPEDQLWGAVQWPLPFFDDKLFPIQPLGFLRKTGQPYHISLLKPAAGYMRFLYWAYSFMATKVAAASTTLIGVKKAADEKFKNKILEGSGSGLNVVEIEEATGMRITDLLSVFQAPSIDPQMMAVVEKLEAACDKATGLVDLIYGMTGVQLRSAQEANIKQGNTQIRPDDMAKTVDDFFSVIARMQMLALQWTATSEQLTPIVGQVGAYVWQQNIENQPPDVIAREYEFRVEAGSSRRPNKATRIDQLNSAMQVLTPVLQGWAQATGQVDPLNALIQQWGKENEIPGIEKYVLQPPPPPPMPQQAPGQEEQPQGPPQGAAA